jgi:hypothetical protein
MQQALSRPFLEAHHGDVFAFVVNSSNDCEVMQEPDEVTVRIYAAVSGRFLGGFTTRKDATLKDIQKRLVGLVGNNSRSQPCIVTDANEVFDRVRPQNTCRTFAFVHIIVRCMSVCCVRHMTVPSRMQWTGMPSS